MRASGLLPHYIRIDFAYATRSVIYVMAGIMIAAAVVAFIGLRAGVQTQAEGADAEEPASGGVRLDAEPAT